MYELTARDVMTADVLCVGADWPLHCVAEFFVEKNISGAPVTAPDGGLLGVVSLRDIAMHASMPVKDYHAGSLHDYFLPGVPHSFTQRDLADFGLQDDNETTAGDVMTTAMFHVDEDTDVREIADTMVRGRIHRLFVTDEGAVVGIVTALDLLRVVRDGASAVQESMAT
jgi:CBS domain-containing protein